MHRVEIGGMGSVNAQNDMELFPTGRVDIAELEPQFPTQAGTQCGDVKVEIRRKEIAGAAHHLVLNVVIDQPVVMFERGLPSIRYGHSVI